MSDRPDIILTYLGETREFRATEVTSRQCQRLRDESGFSMPRLVTDVALDLDAWSFSVMWWFAGLQNGIDVRLSDVEIKGARQEQWDLEFTPPEEATEPGDPEPDEWVHLPEG